MGQTGEKQCVYIISSNPKNDGSCWPPLTDSLWIPQKQSLGQGLCANSLELHVSLHVWTQAFQLT